MDINKGDDVILAHNHLMSQMRNNKHHIINKSKKKDSSKKLSLLNGSDVVRSFVDTLKQSLSPIAPLMLDSDVSNELLDEFKYLSTPSTDSDDIDYQTLFLSKNKHLFEHFEFNSTLHEKIFGTTYFVKPGSKRGQVILHFPSFIPVKVFEYPEGTTNFKIMARLIALSDYIYDKKKRKYKPKDEDVHGKFATFESLMQPLLKTNTQPMTGMLSLGTKEVSEDVSLFLVMIINFYIYDSGRFIHLSKKSRMQIQRVL